jgi:hypothetical protein
MGLLVVTALIVSAVVAGFVAARSASRFVHGGAYVLGVVLGTVAAVVVSYVVWAADSTSTAGTVLQAVGNGFLASVLGSGVGLYFGRLRGMRRPGPAL